MGKLRVAFDPVSNWDIKFYRDFIKEMVSDSSEIDLYLVTTSTDTNFIDNVTEESGIDPSKVYRESDNTAVVARLTTLRCLIFMSYDMPLVNDVNENYPLTVHGINNIDGCVAIIANNLLDRNKSQPLYMTHFQFWVKYITKSLTSEQEKC